MVPQKERVLKVPWMLRALKMPLRRGICWCCQGNIGLRKGIRELDGVVNKRGRCLCNDRLSKGIHDLGRRQ